MLRRAAIDAGAPTGCARYRALQTRFLREHLRRLVPAPQPGDPDPHESALYRGLALITDEFLAEDSTTFPHSPVERNVLGHGKRR